MNLKEKLTGRQFLCKKLTVKNSGQKQKSQEMLSNLCLRFCSSFFDYFDYLENRLSRARNILA